MADDIVERLREFDRYLGNVSFSVIRDAADEIERLRAAGDRLSAAVNAVCCSGPRDEMVELTDAFLDWEARRG